MKRITYFGSAVALCTALSLPSAAQTSPTPQSQSQDQSSLGNYARKVHKDADGSKGKPKVFDNDNLPKDDKLSIVGEASPAAASDDKTESKGENKDAAGNKPAASPEDDQAKKQAAYKQWQQKLNTQKEQIDLASRELDVLQREYQLRAAEMYADVGNRLRNSAQWDKQEADYKQKILDKQKAVEDAKQKFDDMEEEARKAGVPAAMRE
jgi:hypothetical protein